MSKKIYDVVIIGAGASGLTSAVHLKRQNKNLNIAIIEKNNDIGKKINATGNGKCNITNENISSDKYYGSFADKFSDILNNKNYILAKIMEFFAYLGILFYKDSSDRIYPLSQSALSVSKAFKRKIESDNTEIFCNTEIFEISEENNIWHIISKNNEHFWSKNIIFSVGSYASPEFGTNGVSLKMLSSLGIKINYCQPALCPMLFENEIKQLKGVRIKADLKAFNGDDSNPVYTENNGEVQFSDKYISGVCVMNASNFLNNSKDMKISLDLCGKYDYTNIIDFFCQMKKSQPYLDIANMLDGVVGNKLGIYILSDYLGYDILKKISSLDNSDFRKITSALKNLTFNHLKKGTYKQSQTTMGGVDASCVDNNLQIINHSGLFVCGEACDINGICGGYNLTWAFISAMLADDKILMDF
jgi:hypothetical protein